MSNRVDLIEIKRKKETKIRINEDVHFSHIQEYVHPNQLREALEKGYQEMSRINLMICRECLHAEYEAEHMVERRLVSGG